MVNVKTPGLAITANVLMDSRELTAKKVRLQSYMLESNQ